MVSLLKDGQWTLLPPPDMLQKIRDLYMRNHDNGTFNRTHFLEVGSQFLDIVASLMRFI